MATTAPPPQSAPEIQLNGSTETQSASESTRAELRLNMLRRMRPYPLKHEWVFWHDRNASSSAAAASAGDDSNKYEDQLKEIAQISTIQTFWQVFNNTPFTSLPMRDSYRLFKKGVKPIWEDPRNATGGAWTFRVPKAVAHDFWKEIQMMAVGETLQEAAAPGDDICGVSVSVRFNSHLVMVWNRRGDNEKSIQAILERVLEALPEELRPPQSSYYYKKHVAHKGYTEKTKADADAAAAAEAGASTTASSS